MIERLAACSSAATDAALHRSPHPNQLSTSRAPCPLLPPLQVAHNAPSGGGNLRWALAWAVDLEPELQAPPGGRSRCKAMQQDTGPRTAVLGTHQPENFPPFKRALVSPRHLRYPRPWDGDGTQTSARLATRDKADK